MGEARNREELEDSLSPGFAVIHLREPEVCVGGVDYYPIPSRESRLTSIDSISIEHLE